MRILLIHTCAAEGLVALADSDLPVPVLMEERLPGRGSSEALMPAIRRIFVRSGWKVTGIDGVAVVDGPGSFTGVRVGLSAAKGICEAAGIGMVAISRLALVAAAAGQRGGTVAALLDGGRGEFYCGLYRGRECLGENLMGREGVLEIAASGAALVTCEARVAEALAGLSLSLVEEPGALPILAFATAKIAAGDWTDVVAADANYLRRTDAEVLFDRNRAG